MHNLDLIGSLVIGGLLLLALVGFSAYYTTSAHSNIGGAIYAGAHDSTSTATKAYIPAGEYALTFQKELHLFRRNLAVTVPRLVDIILLLDAV